jgi:hypothetical protein
MRTSGGSRLQMTVRPPEKAVLACPVHDSRVLVSALARPPGLATSGELGDAREHYHERFEKISEKARAHGRDAKTNTVVGRRESRLFLARKGDRIDDSGSPRSIPDFKDEVGFGLRQCASTRTLSCDDFARNDGVSVSAR